MPFGKDRSYFNSTIRENLIAFKKRISNVQFVNKDFRDIKYYNLNENDYVYCDPPYLVTTATYNDGWSEKDEKDLLDILDWLNEKGIGFGLSNVLSNKGKTNTILKEWIERNNYIIYHLNHSYSNCNYHAKDKSESTDEIFVTNRKAEIKEEAIQLSLFENF